METDEPQRTIPFQFQFEKSIPSQVKIAEWNPEKDLLAMVSDDSKIFLHRFNWQRLWTISSGKCVTSLCWRPDGKTIAVGFEDGSIAIHDVENGKLLRSLKYHLADVVCLNWEEDRQLHRDGFLNFSAYEDRTSRFFPPAPRAPQMPGVVSGDSSFLDEGENSLGELSNCSHQRFNILCSADKEGSICFSAFGIFPIGKINIHELSVPIHALDEQAVSQLQNAYILKIAMAQDLCRLLVMCSGELKQNDRSGNLKVDIEETLGLHYLVIDTSIFSKRKNELHQVAQQASNIEDLTEVIRQSLSVMSKQWSDAMKTFREKFNLFATLISNHGLDSSPQEEFLSLLGGARTSQALHQYLVNSLGEAGVKRVSKAVCGTGKELQLIVLNHLQPAAEIIGFRIGELRGLSRWRARYHGIGLDEKLINTATEKSGMLLIQVERFMMVLSSVIQQFSNFFNWLHKCIKLLMQEQIDQPLSYNSELIVVFLKFLYDQDPVKELLELSKVDHDIQIELETSQKVSELVQLGGFSDCDYLRRTLAKEFQQTESSFKEALRMPSKTISGKVLCVEVLPLFPIQLSTRSITIPMSVSFYKDASVSESDESSESGYIDYAAFHILDKAFPDISSSISIVRGVAQNSSNLKKGNDGSLEAALLSIPDHYHCVDVCLYKESELVLLLNETATNSEASGEACMVILRTSDLPFVPISTPTSINGWKMDQLKGSVVYLEVESEKFRKVPNNVVAPLAVSASRGVACVFSSRKRALVYILEEDEEEDEEVSGSE